MALRLGVALLALLIAEFMAAVVLLASLASRALALDLELQGASADCLAFEARPAVRLVLKAVMLDWLLAICPPAAARSAAESVDSFLANDPSKECRSQ